MKPTAAQTCATCIAAPMPFHIAFVGAGPTTIYTLCALINEVARPVHVTIFEEQPRAGLGTPYRPGWNDPAMLSNIASVEIPPIEETLLEWLQRQPRARLVRLGIDPEQIDEHAFYPRLALGEYFLDQFNGVVERARARGIVVEIAATCRVKDIVAEEAGLRVLVEPKKGAPYARIFDQVVIATGHQWPEEPEVRPGYFLTPWPATALQRAPATSIGIRGSSLTAIDAVVALATAHGAFIETENGGIDYRVDAGAEALLMVMMSRKGLLPEADFYHPVPYEPLAICTPDAVGRLIEEGCDTLLDRSYALFKQELAQADPEYAAHLNLHELALEDFTEAYFADRAAFDPFEWAETNLREARANFAARFTVPWRYAILRMQEVLALIVPYLDEEALHRFNRSLKPIFVDEYATVPHLSIERLLALHRCGHLDVMALGDDYRVDSRSAEEGAIVILEGERRHFPVFVEATGQRPLGIEAFPFPSLLDQDVVHDVGEGHPDGPKGIAVDELFHPVSDNPAAMRLYCLSIPFLLSRHPFIQGITSSYEMGQVVGAALAGAMENGAH
ncbi:putative NAD(P)/FAD-binding protein YdhS [Sphingomonas vulcanisoli]|uniref:NAD(P)/FAD-binding protein YdhS n=1 Tax=Sphingomonas vulcanisoli TaxID=1658060 RepID=A0ABX0TTW4_9SPHN|nr:FAD/NAD(P)-binding protein [Sphingomonas vulcanisoli]NIJ08493.1 putative NAD(P)/FAD-binding protein YdhS [Sphingomonas vulcanisoli]